MDNSHTLFSERIPWLWILIAAGAIFYIPFIGGVHLFDWDEINFAEISREMILTGDYLSVQVDYKPFYEKPPLFFWLQSLSMHVFGINEFAARLPNAIGGILALVLILLLGKHWISTRFGILWALSYGGSLLPVLYHKSGIIDPWFNLFIFGSIAAWIEGSTRSGKGNNSLFLLSGLLSGLAILTKGPVAPLIIGLTVLFVRIISGEKSFLQFRSVLIFLIGSVVVAGLWFGIEWLTHGPDFITAFIKYQVELLSRSVAGHKGFPGYHFVVGLIGIFPASLFAINAFRKKREDEYQKAWIARLTMILLTMIVLVLFTIVRSKIVHYSSLIYYPVSFLSAWGLSNLIDGKIKWKDWQTILSLMVVSVIFLLLVGIAYAGNNLQQLKQDFQFDDFTRSTLNAEVQWDLLDFFPAIFFILLLIFSYTLLVKSKGEQSIIVLFTGTALLINIILIFYIGKAEHYAQRAAIEFYESKEGQNVEIRTIGFHSYAPYFYAKKPYTDSTIAKQEFFVIKTDKRHLLNDLPELKILYEKNGFIFLEK